MEKPIVKKFINNLYDTRFSNVPERFRRNQEPDEDCFVSDWDRDIIDRFRDNKISYEEL